MKNIDWIIGEAKRLDLFDVFVVNQLELRFQRGHEWKPYSEIIGSPGGDTTKWIYLEVKNLIHQVLTEDQRKELTSKGWVRGVNLLKTGERIRFIASESKEVISLQMRVLLESVPQFNELGLPEVLEKWASKPYGLVLISGGERSGRSTSLYSVARRVLSDRSVHSLFLQEDDLFQLSSAKSSVVKVKSKSSSRSLSLISEGAQVVFIDEKLDSELVNQVIGYLESQKLVFLVGHGSSIESALENLLAITDSNKRERLKVLLGQYLVGAISQILVPGLAGSEELAAEVLVGTPQVKENIRAQNFGVLNKLMADGSEKYGHISLTQSLLQLMLRRKIDIKNAFLVTEDPDGLEAAMKKVGI
jgi:twitching motility protein PilT